MGGARKPVAMGRFSIWSDFVQKKAHTKVCAFLYFAQGEQGASLLACEEVASDGFRAKANSYGENGITLERGVLSCRVAGFCGGNVCIGT